MLLTDCSLSQLDLQPLKHNLLSSDSAIRLASLRILVTSAPHARPDTTSPSDIWSLCLQIELSEMTLKNVRERTSHIGRLGRLLAGLPDDADDGLLAIIRNVTRYLLAQLKVNFWPLYAETVSALAGLTDKHGEILWELVWDQLEKTSAAKSSRVVDLDVQNPPWADQEDISRLHPADEDEADFRCHNLEKARYASSTAWSQSSDARQLDSAEIQVGSER